MSEERLMSVNRGLHTDIQDWYLYKQVFLHSTVDTGGISRGFFELMSPYRVYENLGV